MVINLLSPGDGRVYRSIRLRALAEAPDAFAATHEREKAFPTRIWDERLAHGATFVAFAGRRAIGLVSGFEDEDEEGVVHLVSMWVDPGARRKGVGKRLVDVIVGWARERAAVQVRLWVVDGNQEAAALYKIKGFKDTGERQPLPSNPDATETCLVRWL